jgi:hypothetical protein
MLLAMQRFARLLLASFKRSILGALRVAADYNVRAGHYLRMIDRH